MSGRFLPRIGRALTGVLRQTVNILKTVLNRTLGLPGALLDAMGIRPAKRIRVFIKILRDEQGFPVARPADLEVGLATAQRILAEQANVILHPPPVPDETATATVSVLDESAPREALDVHCDAEAWREDFGIAGEFFSRHLARNFFGTVLGVGAPVTVFIVRDVKDKAGCSLGPLTDFVTVAPIGLAGRFRSDDETGPLYAGTIAHEIAHACALWHVGDRSNLMHPSSDGTKLSLWQKVVLRNSRHVTYW
ncbi:MAG: hypothetical protein K8R36_22600 [Planctomycetales bacterium]|nr:hypothetical protein [Planctomycetales bacterium]